MYKIETYPFKQKKRENKGTFLVKDGKCDYSGEERSNTAAIPPPSGLYGTDDYGSSTGGIVPDYGTGDDSEYGGGETPAEEFKAPEPVGGDPFKAPEPVDPFKTPADPFKAPADPFKTPAAPPPKPSVTDLIKNPTKVVMCMVSIESASWFLAFKNM